MGNPCLVRLNESATPLAGRISCLPLRERSSHAIAGRDRGSRVVSKGEGVDGRRSFHDLGENTQLVENSVTVWEEADACSYLRRDAGVRLKDNVINLVGLEHVGEAKACHTPANNNYFERS